MDAVADDLAQRGLGQVLRDRKAALSFESDYKPTEFKFNPYGIVQLG